MLTSTTIGIITAIVIILVGGFYTIKIAIPRLFLLVFSLGICGGLLTSSILWKAWGYNNHPVSHYTNFTKITPTEYTEVYGTERYEFILEYKDGEKLGGLVYYTPGEDFKFDEDVMISLKNIKGDMLYYLDDHHIKLCNKFLKVTIQNHKSEFEKIKR